MKWFPPLQFLKDKIPKTNKLKLIVMLLILSFILILLPSSGKKTSNPPQVNMINQQDLPTKELETLLSEITKNKVKVLVAYADSGKVDVIREESVTSETKISTGDTRHQKEEKPVLDSAKNIQIQNKYNPKIKGVCIFYFGPYEKETEELLYRAAKGSLGADLHTVEVIFESYRTNQKP